MNIDFVIKFIWHEWYRLWRALIDSNTAWLPNPDPHIESLSQGDQLSDISGS